MPEVKNKKIEASSRSRKKPLINAMDTPMENYFKSFHREGFKYSAPLETENAIIKSRLDAGWDFVRDEKGNIVEYSGKGGSKHILMDQPIEYWQEDFEIQQREIDKTENLTPGLKGMGYLPKGHSQMIENDNVRNI